MITLSLASGHTGSSIRRSAPSNSSSWAPTTDTSERSRPLKVTTDVPDKDGWSKQRNYTYQTSPNERRDVGVGAGFANDVWTVTIYDMAQAVGEKRGSQVALIFDKLLSGKEMDVGTIFALAVSADEKQLALGTGGSLRAERDLNLGLVLKLP